LDRWERLIALRREAQQLDLEQLFTRIMEFPAGGVPVLADFVARIGEEEAVKAGVLQGLLETLQQQRMAEAAIDRSKFMSVLPRPETPETQVRFRRAADGWMSSHGGCTRREMDGPDDWTIRFEDNVASHGTVEEFSLLAAAEETLKHGYDGFVIQSRRIVERTTHGTYYGTVVSTTNSGREARLRIRMIRSGELPSDLAGAEWRIVKAGEIQANLANLPTQQPRTASR
jgi:hypothetical protein